MKPESNYRFLANEYFFESKISYSVVLNELYILLF